MADNTTNFAIDSLDFGPRITLAAVFLLLFLSSLCGNTLVCIAIALDRKLQKLENLFLVSLAASDILVAVLVMSFAAFNDISGKWIFGSYCQIWICSDVMCCTASIFNLSAISFDRYWHIRYPMKYSTFMTKRKILLIITVIWITSVSISFIPLGIMSSSWSDPGDKCIINFREAYAVVSSTISFFLPCSIMIIAYVRLYLFARKHVNMLKQQYRSIGIKVVVNDCDDSQATSFGDVLDDGHRRKSFDKSDHKARVTLGVIMGVFLVCWVPFFCVNILRSVCIDCVPVLVFQAVTWFGYANSAVNPIIYSIFSKDFRGAFHRLLLCRKLHNFYASSTNLFTTEFVNFMDEKRLSVGQQSQGSSKNGSDIRRRLSFQSFDKLHINLGNEIVPGLHVKYKPTNSSSFDCVEL